jgi:glycosyltransferase involved in cell wall biosynthesis
MDKKILVISPVATHPQNSGNRSRIYSLTKKFKDSGCNIHFLYYNIENYHSHIVAPPDIKAMKKEWNEFTHYNPYKRSFIPEFYRYLGLIGRVLKKKTPWIYKYLKPFFPNKNFDRGIYTRTALIDDHYPEGVDQIIRKTCRGKRYDIVIVEYVFMSKALEIFPDDTLKIIDTHDIFTDRNKKVGPQWWTTTANEEAKGLNRADIVIAIQENEKICFENMFKVFHHRPKIITIGHSAQILTRNIPKVPRKKLLFIGTAISTNIAGINIFIKNILPELRAKIPDIELIIAGNVCKNVPDSEGCIKLGEIENLNEAYEKADLVIAPVFLGTGLKIKVIEAISHGKPVIATTHASEGLEKLTKIKNSPLITANTHKEFTKKIIKTLTDGKYAKRSKNAYIYAKKYNKEIEKQIRKIIKTRINKRI